MFQPLKKLDLRLKSINIITGEGAHANLFSSNDYSIGKRTINLVDAGEQKEIHHLVSVFEQLHLSVDNLTSVIITHSHDDHWEGVKTLLRLVPLQIMVFEDDIPYYQQELKRLNNTLEYHLRGLSDGEFIEVENHRLQVLHTPGHDSGSICLYDATNRILFSGDTVFASGTTGSLRSGNLADLARSLRRLTMLDVDILLPGHGDLALKNGNKAIQLALERLTWLDRLPDDAPYWMKIRRSQHKSS
ncbi:MAG: MBL fold metallo-hydrolase [Candidatus Bathyarchaeota archaeon]|nr:MAG: MBL fold metallo-hydrolase [Candidatus Bathyarchaeota archaeon]